MMEALVHTELSLAEEIESIEEILKNEVSRYEGKLSWTFTVEKDVDTDVIIPKMLIGIFVENALHQGMILNGDGGRIDISTHNTSLGLLIMVNDYGIQFNDISMIRQLREKRLRSLDAYLRIFNENHPYIIHYDILDRSVADTGRSGSRILITLQNQKNNQ